MKVLVLFLLCWLAVFIVMVIGYVLGRSIGRNNTAKISRTISFQDTDTDELLYIEVVWRDGIKTKHYLQKIA